jgi:hypothetical protein
MPFREAIEMLAQADAQQDLQASTARPSRPRRRGTR